jgi:mitochondrial enoyl-[acyl-carrier protein] reductase / trans-2-enoyl-CoA reductase
MKAIQYAATGAPWDVVKLVDLPDPEPGAREILVETLRCTINPADLLVLEGRYGTRQDLPAVPGTEGIGRIVALGAEVRGFAIGDLVAVLPGGAWAERRAVKANAAIKLPPAIDLAQAAMLKANPATAEVLLSEIVPLKQGDWIIQNTANSAVGRFVIQLARGKGVRTLNVVRRADIGSTLTALGADAVLVHDGVASGDLRERARAATGGAPIVLAIDAIAGDAAGALAACLGDGGTLVNYGLLSGAPCRIDAHDLVFRDIKVRGFWLAKWFAGASPDKVRALYARLLELLAAGKLNTPVEAVYPFARIADALRHAARDGRSGKVQLEPGA